MSKLRLVGEPKEAPEEWHEPPWVPSRGLVVIQFGIPHLVYHQGTDLDEWIANVDNDVIQHMVPVPTNDSDGVYTWSGRIDSWSCGEHGTDYDSCLECTEFRPATKEEWESFTKDEIVWDFEEFGAYLDWKWKNDRATEENS